MEGVDVVTYAGASELKISRLGLDDGEAPVWLEARIPLVDESPDKESAEELAVNVEGTLALIFPS